MRMATEAAQAFGAPGAIGGAAAPRCYWPVPGAIWRAWSAPPRPCTPLAGCTSWSAWADQDWRSLEIEALIGLARPGQGETALAEFEATLSPAWPVPGAV